MLSEQLRYGDSLCGQLQCLGLVLGSPWPLQTREADPSSGTSARHQLFFSDFKPAFWERVSIARFLWQMICFSGAAASLSVKENINRNVRIFRFNVKVFLNVYFFMNPACLSSDSSLCCSSLSLFHALLLTTVKYLLILWLSRPQYFSFLSLCQYCLRTNTKQEGSQAVKWPFFQQVVSLLFFPALQLRDMPSGYSFLQLSWKERVVVNPRNRLIFFSLAFKSWMSSLSCHLDSLPWLGRERLFQG